jgi:putative ABC transport system permease protein
MWSLQADLQAPTAMSEATRATPQPVTPDFFAEFGVRMALGAERLRMLKLVLSEGLSLALAGLALGIAGALATGRLLRSMLVGIDALDWPTLGLVSLFLLAVAVLALIIPARHAMSVSPTEALRS